MLEAASDLRRRYLTIAAIDAHARGRSAQPRAQKRRIICQLLVDEGQGECYVCTCTAPGDT